MTQQTENPTPFDEALAHALICDDWCDKCESMTGVFDDAKPVWDADDDPTWEDDIRQGTYTEILQETVNHYHAAQATS